MKPMHLALAIPLYLFWTLGAVCCCIISGILDERVAAHERDGGKRIIPRAFSFELVRWGRNGWETLTWGKEDRIHPDWRIRR